MTVEAFSAYNETGTFRQSPRKKQGVERSMLPTNDDGGPVTQRPIVPKEMGGKWIAWNSTGDAIIASALTLQEVIAAASVTGEEAPSFEKVPPPNVRLVGVVW